MKTLLFLSILTFFTFNHSDTNGVEITKKRVTVNFTRHLEFNDLVKIKLDVAEVGISLTYQTIIFDDYNKLKDIAFKVDCNDGYSGSAATKNLSNHSKFGFIRDYKADVPFATGSLENE